MFEPPKPQYAVAAIRVSSLKQGLQGDSIEHQLEQIQRFAATRNIKIKKTFRFTESASNDKQPMQQAIDYCKNPKHHIELFIVKSIDRLTRGGSYSYSGLKMQLEGHGIQLVDIYGIVGMQKVNTLEHLGISYPWSVYDPTKNSELLEAERAKDEKRDIMSRMIGNQIRYARLGYWMRRPPYGFRSKRIETYNGKRCLLLPEAKESPFIVRMFELKAQGLLNDQQIVDTINDLGFRSRTNFYRNPANKMKIIGQRGGNILTVKALQNYVQNPIYAGIVCEKWTNQVPVRGKFKGLVSVELFNQANRGKVAIAESNGQLSIQTNKRLQHQHHAYTVNDYMLRKVIRCPFCIESFSGSASRGKSGKYYPAYHCSRYGHYFRVPKSVFEETVTVFVRHVSLSPLFTNQVCEAVISEWAKRQQVNKQDHDIKQLHIAELQSEAKMIINNMKFLKSAEAVSYMEQDLLEIEKQLETFSNSLADEKPKQLINDLWLTKRTKHTIEHLDSLLLSGSDGIGIDIKLGLLFEAMPTYTDISEALNSNKHKVRLSPLFKVRNSPDTI